MPALKLLLLLVFTGLIAPAEENTAQKQKTETTAEHKQALFSYLRCHRQAKNIVVNWGMTSVTGVNHFVVYHSEVGDLFDPIEEIFPDGTLKYTHKHLQVFPGYHYYYIAAVMNSGAVVNSPVDVVRIVGH